MLWGVLSGRAGRCGAHYEGHDELSFNPHGGAGCELCDAAQQRRGTALLPLS